MSKKLVLTWGLFWFGFAVAHAGETSTANDRKLFQFKFDPHTPLVYAVEAKRAEEVVTEIGSRQATKRTTTETSYKVRLTGTKMNRDGSMVVYFDPFDFKQDIHSLGSGGEIDSTARGLTIVAKQNGIVMVDTEKGIGMTEAQNLKQSVYPFLLSGCMHFEPSGVVKGYDGDLPFIDSWQHTLIFSNFFVITFPTHPIRVDDTWTNTYALKTGGPVTFDDEMIQPWSYIREADEMTTNGPIAVFSLQSSKDCKDLNGYIEERGQQTAIYVPEVTGKMSGTFQFDPKRGCLISASNSGDMHMSINMMIQGNSAQDQTDSEQDTTIRLISP